MKRLHCIVILFTAFTAASDEVIWSYDLTELPEGWDCQEFTFSEAGANTDLEGSFVPDSGQTITFPYNAFLLSEILIVPPGLDSLVIDVSQYAYLAAYVWGDSQSTEGIASASVRLNMEKNGWISTELWYRSAYTYSTPDIVTDSLPIHVAILDVSQGDLIRFRFHAHINGFYGSAEVDWTLWDAQLTAYGTLPLIPRTWSAIKSLCYY